MVAWLAQNGVPHEGRLTKPQLYNLIKLKQAEVFACVGNVLTICVANILTNLMQVTRALYVIKYVLKANRLTYRYQ